MSILMTPELANGGWYDDLNRAYYTDQALSRSTNIRGRSGNGRYLVAGHGFGHLVNALRNAGNTETCAVAFAHFTNSEAHRITLEGFTGSDGFVFEQAHGYSSTNTVKIRGASPKAYNGTFVITVVNANTFTYTALSTPSASPAIGQPMVKI